MIPASETDRKHRYCSLFLSSHLLILTKNFYCMKKNCIQTSLFFLLEVWPFSLKFVITFFPFFSTCLVSSCLALGCFFDPVNNSLKGFWPISGSLPWVHTQKHRNKLPVHRVKDAEQNCVLNQNECYLTTNGKKGEEVKKVSEAEKENKG